MLHMNSWWPVYPPRLATIEGLDSPFAAKVTSFARGRSRTRATSPVSRSDTYRGNDSVARQVGEERRGEIENRALHVTQQAPRQDRPDRVREPEAVVPRNLARPK